MLGTDIPQPSCVPCLWHASCQQWLTLNPEQKQASYNSDYGSRCQFLNPAAALRGHCLHWLTTILEQSQLSQESDCPTCCLSGAFKQTWNLWFPKLKASHLWIYRPWSWPFQCSTFHSLYFLLHSKYLDFSTESALWCSVCMPHFIHSRRWVFSCS